MPAREPASVANTRRIAIIRATVFNETVRLESDAATQYFMRRLEWSTSKPPMRIH